MNATLSPLINKISFPSGRIKLEFKDGRVLISQLSNYPAIDKLTPAQRRKYKILGGIGFLFADSDEVFHVSEFLGRQNCEGL